MPDGEKVITSSSGFGEIDHEIIEREINNSSSKRKPYVKYSPEECYKIGKYASENGPIATVRKFQQRFPNMNESTARTFRKRYESDLADAKRQGKTPSTSLPLKPQGRPFLLGEIDEMVQRYILAASNRGSVITRGVAVSTGKSAENLKVDYPRNLIPTKFHPNKVCIANITIRFGTSFTLHIQINIITSQQYL